MVQASWGDLFFNVISSINNSTNLIDPEAETEDRLVTPTTRKLEMEKTEKTEKTKKTNKTNKTNKTSRR